MGANGAMAPVAFISHRSRPGSRIRRSPALRTHPPRRSIACVAECHSQHFLAMPAMRTAPDWTRFPGSTLPWSRCYAESGGALSCVTCHDPHRNAETAPAYYEAKCLSCHPSGRTSAESRDQQVSAQEKRSDGPLSLPDQPEDGMPVLSHAEGPIRMAPWEFHGPLHPGAFSCRVGGSRLAGARINDRLPALAK